MAQHAVYLGGVPNILKKNVYSVIFGGVLYKSQLRKFG